MPETAAPPSFYNQMAQQGTGAGTAPPGGGAPAGAGGDDAEVLAAMAKVAGALKKVGKMKDGAQPYIDRMMSAMKEMIVDVFKADPKSLDAAGGGDSKPPSDNATPPPDSGNPTPPPAAGAPA